MIRVNIDHCLCIFGEVLSPIHAWSHRRGSKQGTRTNESVALKLLLAVSGKPHFTEGSRSPIRAFSKRYAGLRSCKDRGNHESHTRRARRRLRSGPARTPFGFFGL